MAWLRAYQYRRAARYRDEHRVARAAGLGGRRHGDRRTARVRGQRGDRGRGGRVDARPAQAVGLAGLKPLRLEPGTDVDVDLAQRPVARVDEPVPLPGGDDDDLPGPDLALLVAEEERHRCPPG